jgi:ADP-ribose pyrophosphatase
VTATDPTRGDPIRTDQTRVAYRNRFVTVYDDAVTFSDNEPGTHLRVVEGDGDPGVVALAMCAGRIALVRVYRYPLRQWEWGLVRGGGHGPDARVSVVAELREELGREPDAVEPLGAVHPNSGLLASTVQLFLAHYTTEAHLPLDRREVAEVRWERPERVRAEILDGEILDGFTLAAFGTAVLRGVVTF